MNNELNKNELNKNELNQAVVPLSVSYGTPYAIPLRDRARMTAQAGFTHIGLYYDNFTDTGECAEVLAENGLEPLYVHAYYDYADALWAKGDADADRCRSYVTGLAPLRPYAVVFHPRFRAVTRFDGIEYNVRRLLEAAEDRDIVVAFENLGGLSELDYIFSRVDHPLLRICYDTGHENAIGPEPYDVIKAFGSKIAVTHLHDNMGRIRRNDADDMHLLPFDGEIDWAAKMAALKAAAPDVTINIETHKYKPPALPDEDFLREAHKRATALHEIFSAD